MERLELINLVVQGLQLVKDLREALLVNDMDTARHIIGTLNPFLLDLSISLENDERYKVLGVAISKVVNAMAIFSEGVFGPDPTNYYLRVDCYRRLIPAVIDVLEQVIHAAQTSNAYYVGTSEIGFNRGQYLLMALGSIVLLCIVSNGIIYPIIQETPLNV